MVASSAPTILYVDDDDDNRLALTALFQQAGYWVVPAGTGQEALRLATQLPDLIILDVHLPDMNGFEVCRRLKENPATSFIPVLHISGAYVSSDDRVHGLDYGADGYLIKPVDAEELLASIRALLRMQKAETALRTAAQEWQSTFDAISDAICLLDLHGIVLRCNQAMASLLNRRMAEILNRPLREVVPGECAVPEPPVAVSGGVASRQVMEQPWGDRWFRITTDPVRTDQEVMTGAVQIWADITERRQVEQALRSAEDKYRGIFENVVEGIFQSSPEGRMLTANPALATMLGYESPQDMLHVITDIGRQLHVLPERRDDFLRTLDEHGFVRGFECQVYRKDGSTIWISLHSDAVRDASGRLLYLEGVIEDITERKQAEEALRLRARQQAAVAALGQRALASPGLEETLSEAANLVAHTLDVALVAIFEIHSEEKSLLLRAGVGWREGYVGRLVLPPGPGTQAGYALLSNAPVIVGDIHTEPRFHPGQLLVDHGAVSTTSVVIPAPHGQLGVLSAAATSPRNFTQDDIHFLQAIANVLAAATERHRTAELMLATQAEFVAAQRIQRKLFPVSVPALTGFEKGGVWSGLDIAGASFPADATGGDYFDYIPLLDGSLGIVIGDVSGHGFGPALLMAETRAYLRALAHTHSDLRDILKLTNQVLSNDIEESRFITLVFARLDPRTGTLAYASAGHLTGYILDGSGVVKRQLKSTGLPLGVAADSDFDACVDIALDPGDLVLFFTDGLEEALSPDDTAFGVQRILDLVRVYRADCARLIVDNLYHGPRAFSQNQPQGDDITAVVIRVPSALY